MASRFFVPPEQVHHQKFTLLGSEARHAVLVLRKKVGDVIDLFDGKDLSYQGRIESVSPERVEGVIVAKQPAARASKIELILCQALIKGPKWDWLVEKACEIGVSKLVPLITKRTVVKPAKPEARDRWKRIALAASKQCGRSDVMDITGVSSFAQVLQAADPSTLLLIPWEKENKKSIRQACQEFNGARALVFIGPEGGWEAEEIELARRHGAVPVRLGPTLLRSETAGLVAATLVLNEFGA